MPKWGVFAIGAAIIAIAVSIAAVLHHQQVHLEQTAAAEARFKTLDGAYAVSKGTQAHFLIDFKKMNADLAAATTASKKRHDEAYSLSIPELIGLAHTERLNVESIRALQENVDGLDQSLLEALATVYGEGSVSKLRQDMTERNEAREDGINMWWRAAESVEDDFKAEQNEASDPYSDDEIARDYNETAKDETHARQLQLEVNRFSLALEHRLAVDWRQAKQAVSTLQGKP